MATPYLTDSEWLDIRQRDDIDEYEFSERVSILLQDIDRPTQRQIIMARQQALEEIDARSKN